MNQILESLAGPGDAVFTTYTLTIVVASGYQIIEWAHGLKNGMVVQVTFRGGSKFSMHAIL